VVELQGDGTTRRSAAGSQPARSGRGRRWRLALLALLVAAGVAFALTGPVDRAGILAWGEALAQWPWTAPLLVLAQALLFALGLPGTLVVWLIAPFYPPLVSTMLMLLGSVLGAAAAYAIAGYLGDSVYRRVEHHRTFRILSTRSDFFTQAALRVLPGFPHGIINYSAGLLRLPPGQFLLAAVLGLAVKWTVYCWSIHALFHQGLGGQGPGAGALLALVLLTLFLGVGSWITHRLKARASP